MVQALSAVLSPTPLQRASDWLPWPSATSTVARGRWPDVVPTGRSHLAHLTFARGQVEQVASEGGVGRAQGAFPVIQQHQRERIQLEFWALACVASQLQPLFCTTGWRTPAQMVSPWVPSHLCGHHLTHKQLCPRSPQSARHSAASCPFSND